MSDLERADALLYALLTEDDAPRQEAMLARALAAARREARAEALEQAARVCEGGYTTGSMASTLKAVAAAIRKLKSDV